MQERVKQPTPPRNATTKVTISIDSRLAAAAAADGLDLSVLMEQALIAQIGATADTSLDEHEKAALEATNRFVQTHGPWWDDRENV